MKQLGTTVPFYYLEFLNFFKVFLHSCLIMYMNAPNGSPYKKILQNTIYTSSFPRETLKFIFRPFLTTLPKTGAYLLFS